MLRVLLEYVRVSFEDWDVGDLVCVRKDPIERCECRSGLDEFVAITSDDDASPVVFGEDSVDEVLSRVVINLRKTEHLECLLQQVQPARSVYRHQS